MLRTEIRLLLSGIFIIGGWGAFSKLGTEDSAVRSQDGPLSGESR